MTQSSAFPASKVLANTVIEAAANYPMILGASTHASFQVNATVNSSAKTFVDQTKGTAVANLTADITYTDVNTAGTSGDRNDSTIEIIVEAAAANPTDTVLVAFTGTAAAIVITVTPNDGTNNSATPVPVTTAELVELINDGVITGKTATITDASSLRTLQTAAGGDATDLAAGGEGDEVTATFASGVNAAFNITTNVITKASHGFFTGLNVQLTSTATLPTGLATGTDYYVKVCDADTYQLFSSLAYALAAELDSAGYSTSTGVKDITALGTNGATHTATPVSISGVSYKIQKSNDYVQWTDIDGTIQSSGNWVDAVSGETHTVVTNNITATAVSSASVFDAPYTAVRVLFAISDGTVKIKVIGTSK